MNFSNSIYELHNKNLEETQKKQIEQNILNKKITSYSNPLYEVPILSEIEPLQKIEISKDHGFRKIDNTTYLLTEDCYPDTEIMKVLTEKRLINKEELQKLQTQIGDVIVTDSKRFRFFGLVVKPLY